MVDTAHIDEWMRIVARRVEARTGIDILDLLLASYGRVVVRETRRLGRFDIGLYPAAPLNHIIDWLVSAKLRNEEWLLRVDGEGRPRKLMKLGSVPQMTALKLG
jgi:hypothetical protein